MPKDSMNNTPLGVNEEAMPDHAVIEPIWPDDGATEWRDAAISGNHSPEWEALLQRPITLLLPKDKRRNAKQTQWTNRTASLGAWLYGKGGLTSCPVKSKKGFYPFVPGAGAGGTDFAARTKNGMVTLEFLAFDVDSGDSLTSVLDEIEARGLAALTYASYNDQTTFSEIPRDKVLTFIKAERDPTNEEVRAYLRQQGKYREHHIDSVEIADQSVHTTDGVMIRLKHAELEKFRILFPLAEALRITDLAPTQRKAHDRWKRLLLGYADHLGLLVDHSCVDVSRAYYVPSCRPKVEPCIDVIRGRPLTLAEVEQHERPDEKREAKDGPGSWLKGWAKGHAHRIRMADLIRENAPEMVVREVEGDKIEVICSNKYLHSDEVDGSAWVTNAGDDGRGFGWGCQRNGCKTNGLDRLDHLAKAIEDGWFDEDLIEDEAYLWHDDEEEDDDDGVIEDADDLGDVSDKVRQMVHKVLGDGSDEAAVRKFIQRGAQRQSLTEEDRAHVLRIAEERTAFDREQVREIWQEFGGGDVPEVAATPRSSDIQKPIHCAKWIKDTHGFERIGTDIWTAKGKDDDESSAAPVCQTFKVVGDAMDDTRSSGAALIVEFKNRTGEKVEMSLPRSEIVSESGGDIIKNLADAGFTFHGRGTHLKNNFLRLLNNISVDRHITVSPRPGWQRDRLGQVLGFLLPTDEFIRATPEQAATTKLSPAGAFEDRKSRGTLEEWLDAADAAMWFADPEDERHKNSNFHWTLGLCAAFVGPIIGLADLPPRGINLSGDSSKGKSLALQLGASVWGNPAPRSSAFFPMNNTANAMEDLCTIGSETVLCLDEIGALNNKRMLSDALFNVALGSGKGRKKGRDAGLAKGAKYRPFVMLSNERTLRVEIESAGKRGDYRTGTSVRFPDISVTGAATVSQEAIARLKKANANFGHAGPAFIRHLVEAGIVGDVEALKARVSAAEVEIARTAVGDGAAIPPGTMRAAEVFGLLVVAGELACEAGLLPNRAAVRASVLEGFRRFISSGEGEATKGEASMLDGFRSALTAAQGRGALVQAKYAGEVGHQKRIGWYTDTMVILDTEAIKNVNDLELNGTLDGLLKALSDCDALIRRDEKNRTHEKLPSEVDFQNGDRPRRLPNYRIDREKLEW